MNFAKFLLHILAVLIFQYGSVCITPDSKMPGLCPHQPEYTSDQECGNGPTVSCPTTKRTATQKPIAQARISGIECNPSHMQPEATPVSENVPQRPGKACIVLCRLRI